MPERADAEEHPQQAKLGAAFPLTMFARQRIGGAIEHAATEADEEHKPLDKPFALRESHTL